MDWMTKSAVRLPLLLAAYFVAHVILRVSLSPSLDFDESEQVFLTQFMAAGYNNQPPLYTWIQIGFQQVFGCTILSLAVQKNLFLFGTYLCVQAGVHRATGSLRLAIIAALGMFTVPQIAWESQRDLSHTVAAMFAASLLFLGIVRLTQATSRRDAIGWYSVIGVAIGIGLQFKYNFAIVVVSFLLASLLVPRYRLLVLDARILISVAIAVLINLPNAWWIWMHPDTATQATFEKMTTNGSSAWVESVSTGLWALAITLFACSGITLWMFWVLFLRGQRSPVMIESARRPEMEHLGRMLGYFLLIATGWLLVLVLTGYATDFKNRWIQPIVFLLPVFLAVRNGYSVLLRPRSQKMGTGITMALMVVILLATYGRTQVGRFGGKYSRLNTPFVQAAEQFRSIAADDPKWIVAADMRVAGNMRLAFPNSRIISLDAPNLTSQWMPVEPETLALVVAADPMDASQRRQLARQAAELTGAAPVSEDPWESMSVPLLYGAEGDTQTFSYYQFERNDSTETSVALKRDDRKR